MKKLIRVLLVIVLLGAGAAIGFPMGQHYGFLRGSEWALVQADILAREAGVFMPVRFEQDKFHVVLPQPKGIYTRTRRLADQWDVAQMQKVSGREIALQELAYAKH